MKRKLLLLTFLACALSGCASALARVVPGETRLYDGTRTEAELVSKAFDENHRSAMDLWVPLFLLDLPMSFVVDTIFLPFDLVKSAITGP